MNVKEFQAGKTGICPVCGVKMQIPLESTRPSSRKKAAPSAAPVFAASPESDPLNAADDVAWYVHLPDGGQWGPATTDVFRRWLAEGRLKADQMVWREGWSAWREAGVVFPQLASGQTIPELDPILPEPLAALVHGHAPQPHVPPPKIQRIVFGVLGLAVLILMVLFLMSWLKS